MSAQSVFEVTLTIFGVAGGLRAQPFDDRDGFRERLPGLRRAPQGELTMPRGCERGPEIVRLPYLTRQRHGSLRDRQRFRKFSTRQISVADMAQRLHHSLSIACFQNGEGRAVI